MTEKLKPCPFCGGVKELKIDEPLEFFYVFCEKCFTTGPIAPTKQDAVEAWNRRV